MSASTATETVLVVGATGNIGVAAINAVLRSGRNVLAVVRSQNSAKKLFDQVPTEGRERITVVEADVVSPTGVQGVVDKVKAGSLPAFQHVYTSVGSIYTGQALQDITTDELTEAITTNFQPNFFVYRATIPYLLDQKNPNTTFTICTGAQGDVGLRPLPGMTQGALFSMCHAARRALADTTVRFNESYLSLRVEFDSDAEKHGVMKSSTFSRVYEQILARPDIKSKRVRTDTEADVENLKFEF